MLTLFNSMGPLFWLMFIFAIVGLGVVGERLFYFHRVNINSYEFLNGLTGLLRQGQYEEALHEARQLPGPMARVVEAVLTRPKLARSEMRDIAIEAANMEVFRVERNIRVLLCAATVMPLLGLLGTVLALMSFYEQPGVTRGGAVAPEIAETIQQALMSTSLGIALAIPLYLFYMYLSSCARKVINQIERAGLESVHIICDVRIRKTSNASLSESASHN